MSYVLLKGNINYLAGEALVYTKCMPKNKPTFFLGFFVSSDGERLGKFSTKKYYQSYEIKGELCVAMLIKFETEKEAENTGIRNLIRPQLFLHDNEDTALNACKNEAINYINTYYYQIKKQYNIDFKKPTNFVKQQTIFCNNLDFLIDKMLEAYNGCFEMHQAEAAVSFLRRIGEIHTKSYKDICIITELVADKLKPFETKERVINVLKENIKRNQKNIFDMEEKTFGDFKDPPT